jgi:hypothetical protein
MNYQDIPFLIWSEEAETAKRISMLLGRQTNTLIECASPEKVYKYLDKVEYFSCNVFHYTDEKSILYDLIKASLKKRPYSAIFLFSFQEISFEKYQNFIRLGVSDILVYRGEESQVGLLECLLKTLNYKWKTFRYLQKERKKIFDATVVTAYHELNQPLTVMLNSIGLFEIEMKNQEVNAEKVQNLIGFIQKSTDRIQEVLDLLKEIKYPQLKEYSKGVPMVKLDSTELNDDEDI